MPAAPDQSQPAEDTVRYTRNDAVAVITLNRPARLNALIPEMTLRLLSLLQAADSDDQVRAVVLTGAGRGFCSGADYSRLQTVEAHDVDARHRANPRDVAMRMSKPLIAAVNGAVSGAGLAYALMADIRIAAAGAKWTTAFARHGLVAEMGSSWLLSRLVGPGRAKDLLLTARVFTSEEAYEYGLVQTLCPAPEVLPTAISYAQAICAHPAHSILAIKQQLQLDLARSFEESYWDSVRRTADSIGRQDFRQGLTRSLPAKPTTMPGESSRD